MSELGQKRPKGDVRVESGLPQTADIRLRGWQVSSVPRAEVIHRLLDHFVGEREQRRRDFEAERFRGFEVDHELELGGLNYRQVGGLLALENPPGVNAGLAIG